jgi:hypothetical protein
LEQGRSSMMRRGMCSSSPIQKDLPPQSHIFIAVLMTA